MANSFFNKVFKAAQSVPSMIASIVVPIPVMNYSVFSDVTNWSVNTASGSCVEKPRPPIEEESTPDPQPRTEAQPSPPLDPVDIIIPVDDRTPPSITAKTTSVGKKIRMIDHNSFYAYNPNNEFDTIPWSEGIDPVRFLLGRLWTQNPPPHLVGSNRNLYGKSVIFGHKIMERTEDWVQAGDKRVKFFQDPVKLTDLRSGKVILDTESEDRDPVTRQETSGKTSVFLETPKGAALVAMKQYYKSLFDDLPSGEKPIFCDLAEYGTIKLKMNPEGMQSDLNISKKEIFKRLIFGGTRDYGGSFVQNHTFPDKFQFCPIGRSGGLCATIGKQQLAHGTYSDHSFEMDTPLTAVNLKHYASLRKPMVASIEPTYNFYCREYENIISGPASQFIDEHSLPNIYTFMTEKYSEKLDYQLSPTITNFLRLNPTLTKRTKSGEHKRDSIYGFFVDKVNARGNKESETSTGMSYFKKWASAAQGMIRARTMDVFNGTHSYYTKQTFPYSEGRMYLGLKDTKPSFPMLVDISFSTDRLSPIADAIARAKLDCYLSCYIHDYEGQSPDDMLDRSTTDTAAMGLHKSEGYLGFIEAEELIIGGSEGDNPNVVSSINANIVYPRGTAALTTGRKCMDIEEWIRSIGELPIDTAGKMFFGESNSLDLLDGTRASTGDVLGLLRVYLAARIKKLVKEEGRFRELEQVYNGKLCYNETLMYKVEKFKYDPGTGAESLVTQFLVPNKTDTESIHLTDTQVKYDNLYYYKISSINLVIGNEYFFVFPGQNPQAGGVPGYSKSQLKRLLENEGVMKINYCNYPSVKIIEAPFFNQSSQNKIFTRVVDRPPVPPMAKVDVYKGVTNRVLISLNSGVGDFVASPIMLSPTVDAEILERILQNQRNQNTSIERNDIDGEDMSLVRFKSDDPINTFEIYRTTTPPSDYSDFVNQQHAYVNTYGKYSSGSLVDEIQPNRKYYYTFRSIDAHGYFSNPTMVYEVEIVSADGLSYPIIRVYHPGDSIKTPMEPTRSMRKFIEIKPNIADTEINLENSGLDGVNNMIQSKLDRNKKISSAFPYRRVDFSKGSQYKLGESGDTTLCWGKKFKIRLTSKQSGKKLDLNVRFNYTDSVDPNDFYINQE